MPQAAARTGDDRETRDIPALTRAAQLVPTTWNEADNSVDVVWTTGARRRTYDWFNDRVIEEELAVTPEAVDMTRFEAGTVQVIDAHNVYSGVSAILGIAQRGSIVKGEGRATIRLSTDPAKAGTVGDIKAGVIRAMSFGYTVQKYEVTLAQDRTDGGNVPLYRAVRWTPQELTFCAIGADPHAAPRAGTADHTRSQSQQGGSPCEFIRAAAHHQEATTMTEAELQAQRDQEAATRAAAAADAKRADDEAAAQRAAANKKAVDDAVAAEKARAGEIRESCKRAAVPDLADALIRDGKTVEQANIDIAVAAARRDAATGGHRNVNVRTVGDEMQTRMAGMEEAIHSRVDHKFKLTDNGRQFRGMGLLELGRELLEAHGVATRGLTRMELAGRMLTFRSPGMHTTSDFANLFGNVANKRLRQAYEQEPGSYTVWARRAPPLPDFKPATIVALSGAPDLLKVNEHGEFKYGTLVDGGATYRLFTYGRIVALTRQAIVNDDLRAFDRLNTGFGDSSARLENRLVYAELTGSANMSDGNPLFHAAHGNLGSGAGSVLSLDALSAGRAAMRKQKGLAGEQLNITPRYLIVPAALEGLAYQLTSANYTPTTQGGINEFAAGGRTALTVVVEPLLDAISATAWYLASANGSIDTVEYAFLEGEEGPVMEAKDGFEIDGTSWKCREDFAATATDWRGLYKSAGA